MKVLIQAINGIGLGHVIRTLRIADALKESNPDVDIVFVTNTRYSEILEKKYKTYTLKKDTRMVIEGVCSYQEYLRYNTMAITKIILHENPDGMLFDSELNRDLLLFCKKKLIKTAYVLRGVKDERFLEIKEDLSLFNLIIVPHDRKEFASFQEKILSENQAVFTGPIFDPYISTENVSRNNVLITFGAGAPIPGNKLLFASVSVFLKFLRNNDFMVNHERINVDIVTGPFYKDVCDLSGFSVRSTTESLVRDMYKARVVISAAGYNTINEIISTRTPAVIVPVKTRWDDQFKRADSLEKMGCARVARDGILRPFCEVLKNWQSCREKFPSIKNGNMKAAKALFKILGDKKGDG